MAHDLLQGVVISEHGNTLRIIIFYMIALSTLQEVENQQGHLYAIDAGRQLVYLGIGKGRVDLVTGLVSRKGELEVKKEEVVKGGVPKFYKKYELVVECEGVVQTKESGINKILAEHVVVEVILPPSSISIIGYQYSQEVFNVGEEGYLLAVIEKHHLANSSGVVDMIKQSESLIKPFKYTVDLISRVSLPSTNSFTQIQQPSQPKSLRFIGNIRDFKNMQSLLLGASKHLLERGEVKQPPGFLQNLLTSIPKKIWNPHVYLPTPPLFLHQRFMVKGSYEFYHYNDQLFNDNGWGCAYRAFQSLLSWFNLNEYTSAEIPSIEQIQRTLFEIDKTRNLINTKEWIGANEVGWLVNKYVGIESKIIFLQDGENIMEKVDLFKQHFQTMGTPIMYGGGQYAYTILGINYSWKLNECQFLILDPHYILEDKPKSIIDKEGVSWKDKSKLFKKGVYYNFCLPQLKPKRRDSTLSSS